MAEHPKIKSVAIIGAGAAGAITAAAFKAEKYFECIQVFERRESAGGTWIYDADPGTHFTIHPGVLPPEMDPPLEIPIGLPRVTNPMQQERYSSTPIYDSLTTNVPEIAMSFSDARFAYGPFVPHHVPRQYIENYFSTHDIDELLVFNTTVEDVSRVPNASSELWTLTLRRYDPVRHLDIWWSEDFDALVIANGHYSVPYVPYVDGLDAYIAKFPGRVMHSKAYRNPGPFTSKKVLVIGNAASGHDTTAEVVQSAQLPVYQSRRSKWWFDGDDPPAGVVWKPVIKKYLEDGTILFEDGTSLGADDIDIIIYCTGYQPSFPFWNSKNNGQPLYDYKSAKLVDSYQHTFFRHFTSVAVVGHPRVLTFRSFEYQAVALARLWSGRNEYGLPSPEEQKAWEEQRDKFAEEQGRKFHDIRWDRDSGGNETLEWLEWLFKFAGLGTLEGQGRVPPVLDRKTRWAIENVRKYPTPPEGGKGTAEDGDGWVVIQRSKLDVLDFV